MKTMFITAMLAASAAASGPKWHELDGYSFVNYVEDFGKTYSTDAERAEMEANFNQRLEEIQAHNADNTKSWKRGINHMSDWSDEQRQSLLGVKKALSYASTRHETYPISLEEENTARILADLPASVDWRDHGVVTPVKDQGMCGSCWTFSSTQTIESHWALKTGELKTLSEQHMLDCIEDTNKCGGTGGCDGGTLELAFGYFADKKDAGISSEWTYPYESHFGAAFECRYNATRTKPEATVSDFVTLPRNKYEPLIQTLATKGPVAITVDASVWHDYESGVFDGCNQENPDLDHGVQLVGYGTDEEHGDYWLIRNSWTTSFGEKGYIRIRRTSELRCGSDLTPTDGVACEGETDPVEVCGTCGILFDNAYPIV